MACLKGVRNEEIFYGHICFHSVSFELTKRNQKTGLPVLTVRNVIMNLFITVRLRLTKMRIFLISASMKRSILMAVTT